MTNPRVIHLTPMVKEPRKPSPQLVRTMFLVLCLASVAITSITIHRVGEFLAYTVAEARK